jgi:trimethylamine--corrinoid protein Co-methyltransferase
MLSTLSHDGVDTPGRPQLEERRILRREGGRAARQSASQRSTRQAVGPGVLGGMYRPLSDRDLQLIHATVLDVLEKIGMGDPPAEVRTLALSKGCCLNERGRLCFPRALVEDVIAKAGRNFTLHARDPAWSLDLRDARVHFGASGVAVLVSDLDTGRYRPSTMVDLYDFARLVDVLENVHFFNRPVIGRDIADTRLHDVNMAYVCAAGTRKHIAIGFNAGAHVQDAAAMYDLIAGGEGRFRERPFCSVGSCAVVSPLRFAAENCEVSMAAARLGFPINMIIAGQAGATAPAALAGTLVQTTAETIAGLLLVNFVSPSHPVIFSNWPLVSDLRTGAFTGGGGEEAVLTAASAQISRFYDLPAGVGAGMADSKTPDNQAGYEKGITTALAGLAGANMVYEAAGMLASLMACSFEAFVIDDDMLGSVLRAVRGIEVTEESLSFEVIRAAVEGPNHYLGSQQTLDLMKSEFFYPKLGDRGDADQWEAGGSKDIRERARERVREILRRHYPVHLDPEMDRAIRNRFEILIPMEVMKAGNGRW